MLIHFIQKISRELRLMLRLMLQLMLQLMLRLMIQLMPFIPPMRFSRHLRYFSFGIFFSAITNSAIAITPLSVLPQHARLQTITKPATSLGFELGQWHARPEQLVAYYQLLATQSDRVQVRVIGYTHEQRPLLNVIITSPKNQARLADIEAARTRGDKDTPLVVYLGYSVHGNESSGANAAPAVAWHLASSQDPSVNAMLDHTVIIIDPMFNPDGLARFATWSNSLRGQTLVADPNTLEHKEAWPSGRGNHYWFDLNRDKLFLAHPESQAHVAAYQKWRPHVLGDFHEQGTDATYFFQPGISTRVHPLTPKNNQALTVSMSKFHAQAFDARGQLYFSNESYDDFYYGKGSTYPDVQGSVGILFEQASSRGHLQESRNGINGLLSFGDTIANQVTTSLTTIAGADALRQDLISHQQQFYADAQKMAAQDGNRAMLFAAPNNPARLRDFAKILAAQSILVHHVKGNVTINGQRYDEQNAIAVPLQQNQYRLLEAMTEIRQKFQDNSFYDVSAWSMTKSYDLASAKTNLDVIGAPFLQTEVQKGGVIGQSHIAYVFDWANDDAAPYAAALLKAGVRLRAVTKPLALTTTQGVKQFGIGSMIVPINAQAMSSEQTLEILRTSLGEKFSTVQVFALTTGSGGGGIDVGSASLKEVSMPSVALLTGMGLDSTSVGELWYWLDAHLYLPTTHLSLERITSVNLDRYTHIVMGDGNYRLSDEANKALERFVRQGGVIIGVEGAMKWASQQTYLHTKLVKKSDEKLFKESKDNKDITQAKEVKIAKNPNEAKDTKTLRLAYRDQNDHVAQTLVAGAIFNSDVDLSHPLAAGLPRNQLPVFRTNADVFRLQGDAYGTVAAYTSVPVMSGFVSTENAQGIAGSAVVTAERVGSGSVILTNAALGFRGGWIGSRRILDNAIFLGKSFEKARFTGDEEE